ncbi:hypothetical protein GX865_01840 [Candidatus Saccharibacteria bacterium]|jgi:hypothetical protein|nr:hypothetical protein [Candidatus Saccharibacteria bacterium]
MPIKKNSDIKEAAYEYAALLYDLYIDSLDDGIIKNGQNNANHISNLD